MLRTIGATFAFAFILSAQVLPVALTAQAQTPSTPAPSAQPAVAPANDSSTGAPDQFVSLTNLPGLPETVNASTLPGFFNQLYKLCIGAAAVIAVLQIMRAGFKFMTTKGSFTGNEEAKGYISNAVIGLVLVLSPVIVFGVINPDILKLNLDVSGLKSKYVDDDGVGNGGTSSSKNTSLSKEQCTSQYANIVSFIPSNTANKCNANFNFSNIPLECCEGASGNAVCCGKPKATADSQFIVSWYYTRSDVGDKTAACYVEEVARFNDLASCEVKLKAVQSNTLNKTILKSCDLLPPAYTFEPPANIPSCRDYKPVTYKWRIFFQNSNGTGKRWEESKSFQSQSQCSASFDSFLKNNPTLVVSGDLPPACNCSAPQSTFPSCP